MCFQCITVINPCNDSDWFLSNRLFQVESELQPIMSYVALFGAAGTLSLKAKLYSTLKQTAVPLPKFNKMRK